MVANFLTTWMEEVVVVEIVGVEAAGEEDIPTLDDPILGVKEFVTLFRRVNVIVVTHADFLMKEAVVEMLMLISQVVVVVVDAMLDLAMLFNVANATVATAADSPMT